MSWGWIENCFPTKLDRPFGSSLGGELSGLLSRVVSAACSYELKNIPQRFVDPEARSRRGFGLLRRLDLRPVVIEQGFFVIADRPRILPNVAGVVHSARQLAEVFSLDCLQEMPRNSGGLHDFFQRDALLEPRAGQVQVRLRAPNQMFDVGSH